MKAGTQPGRRNRPCSDILAGAKMVIAVSPLVIGFPFRSVVRLPAGCALAHMSEKGPMEALRKNRRCGRSAVRRRTKHMEAPPSAKLSHHGCFRTEVFA